MPDSAAERARRSRRHKRGDHSECDPTRRCELVEQAEIAEAVTVQRERGPGAPERGERGQELWDALHDGLGAAHRLLLDEACRLADRLDRLDAALHDKGTWLRFETADNGSVVVVVDGVLAEYRQQVATLRSLVSELRQAAPKTSDKTSSKQDATVSDEPDKPKGGLGDLTSRIADRRRRSSG